MDYLQATILGLVQGLAEFLPVSSSGHLVLFKDLLGLGEVPLVFDVFLHLATLLSLIVVFRARIAAILVSLWNFAVGSGRRAAVRNGAGTAARREPATGAVDPNLALVVPLIVATVVTGVMGVLIQKFVPEEGVRIVSVELLLTAAVLAATALLKPGSRGPGQIRTGRALFIGFAQGLGVFSGISRSGITIAAGMASGLERGLAGEFSFLLAIPAILGAFLIKLKDAGAMMSGIGAGPLALAFAVAFLSGLAALTFLMRLIRSGKIAWFALYLVPVGIIGLFLR